MLVVPDFIWFINYIMLFRLRSELFGSVVSAALAYPMSGVCNASAMGIITYTQDDGHPWPSNGHTGQWPRHAFALLLRAGLALTNFSTAKGKLTLHL